jgi:molybdopterin synthase catalytic subunit
MRIVLQTEAFDPGDLLSDFTANREVTGAVVSFTGLARADQGRTTKLTLDAYPGFTEAEIGKIVEIATARFGLHDVFILHRTGDITPGEAIVFVATAAAHRREAFEAADFLMDYLKSRAPFWKKEAGPEGERWIEPSGRDRSDAERWDK